MTDLRITPLSTGNNAAAQSTEPLTSASTFAAAIPPDLGPELPEQMRADLHQLLWEADGQLQSVYQARVEHPESRTPTQLLPHTTCAVAGAVSGRLAAINAVFNQQMPSGPSVARETASTVRVLLKRVTRPELRAHLTAVLIQLEDRASDPTAKRHETEELELQSIQLEKTAEEQLRSSPGVYVYTYPHYWTYPFEPDTQRRLLKVGKTDGAAFARIRAQVRQTGAPEDPLLLRVYLTDDPAATERIFHRLLDAAEHSRSQGAIVGREWFCTTIDFCDEIARALNLQALTAAVPH